MVADDDQRWRSVQILLVLNHKLYPDRESHCPLECSCNGPLTQATVAHQPETYRSDDAVGRAKYQAHEGDKDPDIEAYNRHGGTQSQENERNECSNK